MKPRLLVDIKKDERFISDYKGLSRVNLSRKRTVIRIPLKTVFCILTVAFFAATFFMNFASAPSAGEASAQTTNGVTSDQERKALEAQLVELEKQMDQYETKITEYKKQGTSLQSEITRLNNQVYKINLQIKAITLTLKKLNNEMGVTQKQIDETQGKVSIKKDAIENILRELNANNKDGMLVMLLSHPQISDFFNQMNNLSNVQDSLRANVEELLNLNKKLIDQKEILALAKDDAMALKDYQASQIKNIQLTKEEKDSLLKVTKGKESEYKKILAETQKTAAQIRSRLFEFIGGGEIPFGDAYKLAKAAENATGVRAALILAVLDKESALGKNVGKCSYKEAMHPTRDIPVFLDLMEELKMNPDIVKVSCAISADGAYGGAMGPSQFIPSTWIRYKDQIASLTGSNPPSPWRNIDAFTATALYLKNAGADSGTVSAERTAAAKYYAGSRWRNYLFTYGERVVSRAQKFQQDIDVLNS